ncbi:MULTISPECIES: NUMOD4 domain-containing protein [unclassified Serratia (in: enterobacteria)]|uniref:NUMOD4 domain-containing protein n=1 Tax=unclassified Serratia (in: enterobacteria) TaxID=2647522 RepID=UPI0030764C15
MKANTETVVNSTGEEWRPVTIVGFESDYQVSSFGRVRSLARYARGQQRRFLKSKILAGRQDRYGYLEVSFSNDEEKCKFLAHRLIALAFIANPNHLPQVNHKDGNKLNNCASNLEWVTHQQNIQHAVRTGLNKSQGANNKQFKGLIESTNTFTGVRRIFCGKKALIESGFDHGAVYSVINGRAKTHKGFYFKRLPLNSQEASQC